MGYSRNFGMRSFENVVRNGRFRTPPTGTPFKIGAPVVIDPDKPGLMKAAGAAAKTAGAGIVVFEHIQMQGIDASLSTTADLDFVPTGRYAQIMHGAGTKVWFKNTDDKVLYDGRTRDGGSLLTGDISALKPGDGLVPDGAGKYKKAAAGDDAWLTVEQVNPSAGLVEARLTF